MLKFTKDKVETVLWDMLCDRVHKYRKFGFHHGLIQKITRFCICHELYVKQTRGNLNKLETKNDPKVLKESRKE